jgi:iron complex outermembrane receptor protein
MSWALQSSVGWAAPVHFELPAGTAPQMFKKFYDVSDWKVLYNPQIMRNVQTNAVQGDLEPEIALLRMLGNQGFGCEDRGDRQFLVRPLAPFRKPLRHCDRNSDIGTRELEAQSSGYSSTADGSAVLEEVLVTQRIVTGTHLHDIEETGSLRIELTEKDPLWLGATTVPQILRRLPQDSRAGPSEDTHRVGAETMSNSGLGIAGNLRGLGAGGTLVLLNGRRVAPSGDAGSFADLSNVPLSAVERLDVVMDGASALYGSDAIGGVINIVTRDQFSGVRLFADVGGNPDGTQHQYRLGQIGGLDWGSGHTVFALEAYGREPLPSDRSALATSDLPSGPNLGTPYSNPGTLSTSLGTFAVPSGPRAGALDFSTLQAGTQNLSDVYADTDVLPRQQRLSAYLSARQTLTDEVQGFANVLWSERKASQHEGGDRVSVAIPADSPSLISVPADAEPVRLEYDLDRTLGPLITQTTVRTFNLAAGLDFDLPRGWHVSGSGARSLEQQSQVTRGKADAAVLESALGPNAQTPFNPFDGSPIPPSVISAMKIEPWFGLRSELWQLHASADGLLVHLPGGDLRGAFGAEYRNQMLRSGSSLGGTSPVSGSDLGRRVLAGFGEFLVPIVGGDNGMTGLRKLDMSVAARFEHYSDFGSALTPRFWLVYSPLQGIEIRGSYARSTRAPNLADLDQRRNVSFLKDLADPSVDGGIARVLGWAGKNAGLTPEHAISHTVGLHLAPARIPEFEADLNYFDIVFKDRIQVTGADSTNGIRPDVLMNPLYQDIVYRNPTAVQRQHICDTTVFADRGVDCSTVPISAVVDLRTLNIATVWTQGLDVSAALSTQTPVGDFKYSIRGVYLFDYSEQATSHAPRQSLLNTPTNPLNLQLLTSVGWRWRGAGAQLTGNYANGYHDPGNVARPDVRSWLTFDASLQYQFKDRSGRWINDLTIGVDVENLFNQGPPPVVNRAAQIGYDQENGELSGRIIRFRVAKHW